MYLTGLIKMVKYFIISVRHPAQRTPAIYNPAATNLTLLTCHKLPPFCPLKRTFTFLFYSSNIRILHCCMSVNAILSQFIFSISYHALNTQYFSLVQARTSRLLILPLWPFSAIIPHRATSQKIIRRKR